jgi:Tat protein secretion system quality control protein TatD with DNase activity
MPHYVDIAVNLGDPMFRGRYHGKQKHADDLADVLARAKDAGVQRMILTGTSLEESRVVLELAKEFGEFTRQGVCGGVGMLWVGMCEYDTMRAHSTSPLAWVE